MKKCYVILNYNKNYGVVSMEQEKKTSVVEKIMESFLKSKNYKRYKNKKLSANEKAVIEKNLK